jgi:hypothetical protein
LVIAEERDERQDAKDAKEEAPRKCAEDLATDGAQMRTDKNAG